MNTPDNDKCGSMVMFVKREDSNSRRYNPNNFTALNVYMNIELNATSSLGLVYIAPPFITLPPTQQ